MKVNAGQASSTLIPEYIGSDFDKVALVSENLEYIKNVAEGIAGIPVKSYIGDTPPQRPVNGSEWYCTTDGRTYVWYEDGNSSQWVESSPQSTNDGLEKSLDVILDPKYKQIREALRRSYAEAGYNLVGGSFESGGTLTSATDVLLQEKTGKVYSWTGSYPSGGYVVVPDTDPTVIARYVPRTDVLLRAEIVPSVTEALRRSYADAGYTLVDGSFEEGGTLAGSSDVLLHKATRAAYAWAGTFPKVVAAGATPATSGGIGAGAWVDRTDVTLRSDINVVVKVFESVADMVADATLIVGRKCRTLGYYAVGDGGGNHYEIVAAATGTDDGGSYIDLPASGLQAMALFDDTVSDRQFGSVGDGVADDTTAFASMISYAMTANAFTTTGLATSYRPLKMEVSSGVFKITSTLIIDVPIDSAVISLHEQAGYNFVGAGKGQTVFHCTMDDYLFHVKQGKGFIGGFTIIGNSVAPKGIKFGGVQGATFNDSEVVFQSKISSIDIHLVLNSIDISFMWDCEFSDVGVFSGLTGGTMVRILPNTTDNSNNIVFNRCHFERAEQQSFFKSTGLLGATTRHHDIVFNGCHFETQAYNSIAIDLEHTSFVTFSGCDLVVNDNRRTGLASYVPSIKLNNASNVMWSGGQIGFSVKTASQAPNKLIEVSNGTTGIKFDNVFFSTQQGTEVKISDLFQTSTPYDVGSRTLVFKNIRINDFNNIPLNTDVTIGGSNRQYQIDVDHMDQRLRTRYSNSTNVSTDFPAASVFSVDPVGGLSFGKNALITNGSSSAVPISTDISANGAAILLVMADAPGDFGAIVFKRGTTVFSISLGAGVELSSTPAAGKYGIQATVNSALTIYNNIGSDRSFAIFPLVFA